MQYNRFLKYFIPYLIIIFFAMLRVSIGSGLRFNDFIPFYNLVILFYCILYYPQIFPLFILFLLGLLLDYILGHSIGMASINFIVLYVLINLQRNYLYQRAYIFRFLAFVINLVIICAIDIFLLSTKGTNSFYGLLIVYLKRGASTIIVYPVIYYLFSLFLEPLHASKLKSNALQR